MKRSVMSLVTITMLMAIIGCDGGSSPAGDGDVSDGDETVADGDLDDPSADGDLTDGDRENPEGDGDRDTDGDATDGDGIDGDRVDGDDDADVIDGDVTDGDRDDDADGDLDQDGVDGDLIDADPVDGDVDVEGEDDEPTCEGCLIAGQCIPQGQVHPDLLCARCDPEQNSTDWSPLQQGATCRPKNGNCDLPEFCDGANLACPSDAFADSSVVCRESEGACDAQEVCDGTSAGCPVDAKLGVETTCRPKNGDCDLPEVCDGASDTCPVDGFADSSVVCRESEGACDTQEVCDGTSAACPVDGFADTGTLCGDGPCDCSGQDSCDGSGVCQPNHFDTNTPCGDAASACKNQDYCDGQGACGDSGFVPDGTLCEVDDQCVQGECVDCYNANGCSDLPDDELSCTDATCSGQHQCEHHLRSDTCLIDGACHSNDEINPANACLSCDPGVASNRWTPLAVDTPCDDGLFCNGVDVCDGLGFCEHSGDPCTQGDACNNSCNEDAESCHSPTNAPCDDGLFCNGPDRCDGAGTCVHSGDPCTEGDACNNSCNEDSDNCFSVQATSCNDGVFCNGVDSCDGNGNCEHSGSPCEESECRHCQEDLTSCFDPATTACGDPTSEICNAPDSCDGLGNCQANYWPDGTGCDLDGIDCTADACQSGVCQAGIADDTICDFDGNPRTHERCDPTYSCYESGWAKTFGGIYTDKAKQVIRLADGGFAIVGDFMDSVDFDPGSGVDEHVSNGNTDVFVSVYNSDGSYRWTQSFGGVSSDEISDIAQLNDGRLVVVGKFLDTVDFDPTQGELIKYTEYTGAFLSFFQPDGSYIGTQAITRDVYEDYVTINSVIPLADGGFATSGGFSGTMDLDPGSTTDLHTSSGTVNAYVSVFNANRQHVWTQSFGGISRLYGYFCAQLADGGLAVLGRFRMSDGAADFDPTDGVDEHTSNGDYDISITVFEPDGTYRWTRTIGGVEAEYIGDAVALANGDLAVTGRFQGEVDFDPTAGSDVHVAADNSMRTFITVLKADGAYGWTNTIGPSYNSVPGGLLQLTDGGIAVTGPFYLEMDFDPTEGVDERTSSGYADVYLSVFESDGRYRWTETFGGPNYDAGLGIAELADGSLIVAGEFRDMIELDPGLGTDERLSVGNTDAFLLRLTPAPICGPGESAACNEHGSCNWTSGSGQCDCDNLYSGASCESCAPGYVDYDRCEPYYPYIGITGGSFWMGSPDGVTCPPAGYSGDCSAELGRYTNEDLHAVTLSIDYEMAQYEVTQGDFKNLMGWNPAHFGPAGAGEICGEGCPVENVSWYDALAYANQLSDAHGLTPCYGLSDIVCEDGTSVGADYLACMNTTQLGIDSATVSLGGLAKPQHCDGYRLPTEAEWEAAVRTGGGYTAIYTSEGNDGTLTYLDCSLDDNLGRVGWYCGNADGMPHRHEELAPNSWGLHDMLGNVNEWVWDRYEAAYTIGTGLDPTGPAIGDMRVYRGGAWNAFTRQCRSAYRNGYLPGNRSYALGFRLVRSTNDF